MAGSILLFRKKMLLKYLLQVLPKALFYLKPTLKRIKPQIIDKNLPLKRATIEFFDKLEYSFEHIVSGSNFLKISLHMRA